MTTATAALGTTLNTTARIAPGAAGRLGLGPARPPRGAPRGPAGRLALDRWRPPGGPAVVRRDERAVHEAATRGVVGRVAVYSWGEGARPVLLVHGWGARASRFAALVTALLEAGLSPVAYDAWGHGDTPGPVRTIPEHRVVIDELERRHGPFAGVVGHS